MCCCAQVHHVSHGPCGPAGNGCCCMTTAEERIERLKRYRQRLDNEIQAIDRQIAEIESQH